MLRGMQSRRRPCARTPPGFPFLPAMRKRWVGGLVVALLGCGGSDSGSVGSVTETPGAGGVGGISGISGQAGAGGADTAGAGGTAGSSGGSGSAGTAGGSGVAGASGTSGQPGAAGTGSSELCTAAVVPSNGTCLAGEGYPFLCNPVTNEGCSAGEECIFNGRDSEYDCLGPFGTQPLCAPCEEFADLATDATSCAFGGGCYHGECARYCCDDADCPGGACVHEKGPFATLGFCQAP